ncbi:hypothetical protein EKD04_008960 [Chloroflexales bacterium ZM16-3]|nr:hypothetical protein [Chloroflexales bacterium ZM16-3]
MKPRRWYSSPEVNPIPRPRMVIPFASLIQLAYAARTYRQQGSIIKLAQIEPLDVQRDRGPQAPTTSVVVRRIDAA